MTAPSIAGRSPRAQAFELAVSVACAAGVLAGDLGGVPDVLRYALGGLFAASSVVRARWLVVTRRRDGRDAAA